MADLDKAREEFLSEAQELVETFSRCLLSLDEQLADGVEPALVNEAFRAVHTLKGLSALFGAQGMSSISHRLEDVLDQLRLSKLPLTREMLDVLFQAVELYWQFLAFERAESGDPPALETFMGRLQRFVGEDAEQHSADGYDFDPGLLSVLTEYEEHRLRSCIEQGARLFRVRVCFQLATIDQDLENIKARAKPLGEVITYLPTGQSARPDTIDLDLLLASNCQLAELETSLAAENVEVSEIGRREATSGKQTAIPPRMETAPLESVRPESLALSTSSPSSAAPMVAIRSVAQTVRVDIRKLDGLMNSVGELALVRSALNLIGERVRNEGNRQLGAELQRLHRTFDRRLGELQAGILEVRMVPLSQVFDRLGRVVRQISRELDKDVKLVVTGSETEIDKLLVEELSDPLMHIVRNAIDHGIESREERLRMKKPESGTLALNAFQKGNHVVLEVEDDGRGVDERGLMRRAVERGQLAQSEAEELSREEALNLVFLPGLSSKDEASDYSGRGVGMDVVKTNIGRLGGIVTLESDPNVGTRITVTLPITLAIVSALLVRCEGRVYALPLTGVSEALIFEPTAVKRIDSKEFMTLRGASLPVCRLQHLFSLPKLSTVSKRFVVVTSMGTRRLGLVVDELLGQQDIVIKPLGQSLRNVKGFTGASELGDERIALVLDVAAISEEVLTGDARDVRATMERN
jgi:two-component system, chemotaxis family, sensor kinase CheA